MELQYLSFTFGAMLVTVICLYTWYLKPVLIKLKPNQALQILLAVHCFRFISPISLVEGVTLSGLSTGFTFPQVIGDCITAIFALITISALRGGWRVVIPLVWFTNIFGLLDLTVVVVQGVRFGFSEHIGAMFYIVVWYVPWLLLSHTLILEQLFRRPPITVG